MTQTNMAALFAQAKEQGLDYENLPHGEFDVKIKSAKATTTKAENSRLSVTFEALSGADTAITGQNVPGADASKGAVYYWFKFVGNFGFDESFWTNPANAAVGVEELATMINQMGDQRPMRISISQQGNTNYTDVEILGPATGQPDAPAGAAPAAPAPAPATASAPTPPPAAAAAPQDAAAPTPPPAAQASGTPAPPWTPQG